MAGRTQTQVAIARLKINPGDIRKYVKGMLKAEAKEDDKHKATDDTSKAIILCAVVVLVLVGSLLIYEFGICQ